MPDQPAAEPAVSPTRVDSKPAPGASAGGKRIDRMKRMRHAVEWGLLVLARAILGRLPWRLALAVGAGAGALAYHLGIRRRVVLANLAVAFPDRTPARRRRIARESYRNMGRTAVECLLMSALPPDQADEMFETVEGQEFLESAGGTRNAFVAVTAHIGNWELAASYFARRGYRVRVIAKPMHNARVEAALLATRRSCGYEVLYTREGVRAGLRHLRDGGVLAILADQDARKSGIAVPFFGMPASTAIGPAVFALIARVPILPVFPYRIGRQRHGVRCFPPIEPPQDVKRDVAIEQLTRGHVAALESFVREHPGQYFWFHRRWKTPVDKLRRERQ